MTDLAPGLKAERRRASVLLRQGNNAVELLDAELPAVIDYLTRVLDGGRMEGIHSFEFHLGSGEVFHASEAADRPARLSALEDTETGTHWTDRDERSFVSEPE